MCLRKNFLRIALVCVCFIAWGGASAQAAWIWTPQSGKWINPSWSAKDTAAEQFEHAFKFYQSGDYERAAKEFNKVVKKWPSSVRAPEALFYVGLSNQKLGKYSAAFSNYEKVLTKYPYGEQLHLVVERIFEIAELFEEGDKITLAQKYVGVMKSKERAARMYEAVVTNAPYDTLADQALYRSGICYMGVNRYRKAQEVFAEFLKEYPDSDLAPAVRLRLAEAAQAESLDAPYDQGASEVALEQFEEILEEERADEVKQAAREAVASLENRAAQKEFEIGRFYEKKKAHESALLYYQGVIDQYPHTDWAAKSSGRISGIRKMLADESTSL
ncbi:MAG: tetratricopeptide repeat protein [Candidatus Omnitrophica bacterium]|nr:tetratricopeptide repeat protein [Candidatus Omnitrophota bacterium]